MTKGKRFMTPFILKGATKIPAEAKRPSEHVYDPQRQLWIDNRTGVPVVTSSVGSNASRFGETAITATREGADQSEIASIHASTYGETTVTRTSEGADQTEVTALTPTQFGETIFTATVEGADNPEVVTAQRLDIDAPYSHF